MNKNERKTKETSVQIELDVNNYKPSKIKTGIPFFDHMLESFAKHGRFYLSIKCEGDIDIDFHHTVEDVGILLGLTLKDELYPAHDIERFGECSIVMDEACVNSILDISNRAFLFFDVDFFGYIKDFDVELLEEFFRAVSYNASLTLHIVSTRGKNKHHLAEACFKSFGVALRRALHKAPKIGVPSTKGTI